MVSLKTNDRAVSNLDTTMEYIPWSAICTDYQITKKRYKATHKISSSVEIILIRDIIYNE